MKSRKQDYFTRGRCRIRMDRFTNTELSVMPNVYGAVDGNGPGPEFSAPKCACSTFLTNVATLLESSSYTISGGVSMYRKFFR